MSNKNDRIQSSRASVHDSRFLAALDGLVYDGPELETYRAAQRRHWESRLEGDNQPEVFVAREGGMYLGYLAVNHSDAGEYVEVAFVINPKHEILRTDIVRALMGKAGLLHTVQAEIGLSSGSLLLTAS